MAKAHWNFAPEKAFPYECSICGCGHSEPQDVCDRCGAVFEEDEEPKEFVVTFRCRAFTSDQVMNWLCSYLQEDCDYGVQQTSGFMIDDAEDVNPCE